MTTTLTLNLPSRYLQQVQALLHQYAPNTEVWAYGSRVTGTNHEASDLDLVLRNPNNLLQQNPALGTLREAFIESNLPIRVDVMDWSLIPESFRHEIERAYVVMQQSQK